MRYAKKNMLKRLDHRFRWGEFLMATERNRKRDPTEPNRALVAILSIMGDAHLGKLNDHTKVTKRPPC